MNTLKDYPPTDTFVAQLDWLVGPCTLTSASEALEEANFDHMTAALYAEDPDFLDHEIVRWSHFGCGWVEAVFVRPTSRAAELAAQMRTTLDTCAVLDEGRFLEYEAEDKACERSSEHHKPKKE